jgi:hypothetical protein
VGEKALSPLGHDAALDADQLGHLGVRVLVGQQQDHTASAHQPGTHRGGPLPVFQDLTCRG